MKFKRLISLIMATAVLLSILSIPAFAEEDHTHIEIIFEDGVSDEFRDRATEILLNADDNITEDDDSCTYGIICEVAGHKLETSQVTRISHKASFTPPRCIEKVYAVSVCSRCDYDETTLISSEYIYCCE